MPLAYGYGRVSTGRQEISIAAQEQQTHAYWEYRLKPLGVEWGGWYADQATSGRTSLESREAGGALLKRLERGDHIIFAKMDRAFRSAIDQALTIETMLRKKIKPHFMDAGVDASTTMGKLMLQILAAVAEAERSRIGERMAESCAERKRQGLAWSTSAPWGFKAVKRKQDGKRVLVFLEREIKITKRAYELNRDGFTLEEIWRTFRLNGILNRKGGELLPSSLSRMIHRYQLLLSQGKLPDYALPNPPEKPAESA